MWILTSLVFLALFALTTASLVTGLILLTSKRFGQTKLKLLLGTLYAALFADLLYEYYLWGVADQSIQNGGSIGLFGLWWPVVLGALLVGVIVVQYFIYIRYKKALGTNR